VAVRDLPAGVVLRRDDLVVRRYPASAAPVGSTGMAVGRTLAAPVRRGEPVTDVRLVSPALAAAYPDREVLPVRIADAAAVGLLRPGDRVDLVAADPRRGSASYVATDTPVLALPADSQSAGSDLRASGQTGRLVVLAVLPSEVEAVAGAAATEVLSVAISR
jgi:Flp pilus assembly protein CpaB